MKSNLVPLGEIAEFINGMAFKPSDWQSEGRRIIRIQNLSDPTKPYNRTSKGVDPKYIVSPGTILVSWSATLDVFEWTESDEAVLNQHIFKVVPFRDKVHLPYLKIILKSSIRSMMKHTHGSTMKHINRREFLETLVPLPPLPEQKRIAAILDKADAIRRKREKAIELTDSFLNSLFLEMFGDPATNPKGWRIETLESLATRITDGVHQKPNYTNSGVPFVSVKDITTGVLKLNNTKYISKDDHEKFTKRCKPEYLDILYTKVGATYGRPAIVDTKEEFSIYVSVALIKPRKEIIDPFFLREVLATSAVKRQADRSIKGAGVPDLHLVEIKKFLIPVPPQAIQQEFLKRAEGLHKLLARQQRALLTTQALCSSLSQQLFDMKGGYTEAVSKTHLEVAHAL